MPLFETWIGPLSAERQAIALQPEHIEGFRRSQALAYASATAVEAPLRAGMTERQAAGMMMEYLADHGVHEYFHMPFAWFGDRTAFTRFKSNGDFAPSDRKLEPGDPVILDVAPVVDGHASDIGYACALGENALADARARIGELIQRFAVAQIPLLLGLLHRDAAEVALASGNMTELAQHMERARHFLRLTTNAALIASIERLAKRVTRMQARSIEPAAAVSTRTDALLQELLACRDPEQRAISALAALVESSQAGGGFLVLFADGAPYVAAAHEGQAPSALLLASAALRDGEATSDPASEVDSRADDEGLDAPTLIEVAVDAQLMSLHPFALCVEQSGREVVIGVAWLAQRGDRAVVVDRSLFKATPQALRGS